MRRLNHAGAFRLLSKLRERQLAGDGMPTMWDRLSYGTRHESDAETKIGIDIANNQRSVPQQAGGDVQGQVSSSLWTPLQTEGRRALTVRRAPGRPIGQSDILSAEEVRSIVSLPDRRTSHGLRDYVVLLLFSNTPMRIGELVSIKLKNLVDEGDKKFITYEGLKKRSKKKYWLKIPITDYVFSQILRYVQQEYKSKKRLDPNAPLLFTLGKFGPYSKSPITIDAVRFVLEKYVKLSGIRKRITPHSMRATYLSMRDDVPPENLLPLSGHAGLQGLTPYKRANRQKVEEAALSHSFA